MATKAPAAKDAAASRPSVAQAPASKDAAAARPSIAPGATSQAQIDPKGQGARGSVALSDASDKGKTKNKQDKDDSSDDDKKQKKGAVNGAANQNKDKDDSDDDHNHQSNNQKHHDHDDDDDDVDSLKPVPTNDPKEIQKRKTQAEMFKKYLDNSGVSMAFQIIYAEILAKKINEENVFGYTAMRLRQIGNDLAAIATSKGKKGKSD